MKKKKLMMLGGLSSLKPLIKKAHELDIYVITVDYVPENEAHKYSDEYHNVSILDKEAVLKLAKELQIDGIMSFAVDPGVVTAAYVAEKMNLPFQGSYESVSILQDKSKFRQFLTENGFKVPKAKGYDNIASALLESNNWNFPVIVKPVDSAGSKGVSKVENPKELEKAINTALEESHSGNFIIEEFIQTLGFSSDSESFTINGELVSCTFSDQRFDINAENPFVPSAYSWPSTMEMVYKEELKSELQRLMDLLKMQTGIYNVETRVSTNGIPYIMEVSPRGGGPRLAEMADLSNGTHFVENALRSSVGLPLLNMNSKINPSYIAEIVLHSKFEGIFESIDLSPKIKPYFIDLDLLVKKGDLVKTFKGANNSLGTLVLKFPDRKTMEDNLLIIDELYSVKINTFKN